LNSNEIDVKVKEGIENLMGTVENYTQKLEVEQAVRNIPGMKGIDKGLHQSCLLYYYSKLNP
jgi:osmotically-inducible protein OsmY